MPSDDCATISDKESMGMKFGQHVNRFGRKYLPYSTSYVLFLGDHGSRKGAERLNIARIKNEMLCKALQNLAFTATM